MSKKTNKTDKEAKEVAPQAAEDQKIKSAAGKPPLAILPWPILSWLDIDKHLTAIDGLAWAFEYGSRKYQPYNFTKAEPNLDTILLYLGAFLRHMQQRKKQKLDEGSGLPHVDHASASLIMLLAILSKHPDMRDFTHLLAFPGGAAYPHELFANSGALNWDVNTSSGLTDFVKALASVTKNHFDYVEKSTGELERRRGLDVKPVTPVAT